MNTITKTKQMVICGVLVALGVMIPMIMPVKIPFGPYTATLASHVPLLIATLISPVVTIGVTIGTAIGFVFGGFAPVVTMRAASHIFFALFMAFVFKKYGTQKKSTLIGVGLIASVIHAASETLVIALDFAIAGVAMQTVRDVNYAVSAVLSVSFIGTILHHCMDLAIAYFVYKMLLKAQVLDK